MNVEFLFPTPVWHDDVDLNTDALLAFSVDYMNPNKMNGGSYESCNLLASQYRDSKCVVGSFVRQVEAKANEAFQDFGPLNTYAEMDRFWFISVPPGDRMALHTHPGAVLSGVVYLQVAPLPADAGAISIRRDAATAHMYHSLGAYTSCNRGDNQITWDSVTYRAVENKMILFPAWQPHSVTENRSDMDRISVSFNFRVKEGVYPDTTRSWQ
jgi:uncharacterized protein (TIGR02466 family)